MQAAVRPFLDALRYRFAVEAQLLLSAGFMSTSGRLASASRAALVLALCAGCDGESNGRQASAPIGSEGRATAEQGATFDRQAPGSANQVPSLEGRSGTLGYRTGCLFLDVGDGEDIGLAVPAEVTFDGRRMIGKLGTPQGKPIVREIGELVNVSGRLIENRGGGRYSCDTQWVLIADQF